MSALTDPIADLLARLRNAYVAGKTELDVPYSRIKADIVAILQKEGYISEFSVETTGAHPTIKIRNKFVNRTPAITGLKRVSKPGLRRYVGVEEIPRVLGGMGISVLSTPRGILTGREAKRQNVGGELLAYIW
jgi:small subunit ribosomal protein S8